MAIRERFERLQRWDEAEDDPDVWIKPADDGPWLNRNDVLALADEIDRERAATSAVTDEQVTAFSIACLSAEARLAILRQWCHGCGGPTPCNCKRDE